ncbi:gamma-glutamyltransferase [Sulfitobacter guttiformis]|uniref:Glutathione hydrolase proenzyme n=1 Tax=Sulfitobacter guttiformis TaxID=74349 RepID=A0A420DTW9_9RHOB|nr:gamma-glutamyltransferase [Sulfitobacter guttiformis]KIN71280.1 Gamma-glutamyltransferase [Sulfitobacter guttiformis KCTC 32187]RKE97736.1 gamma-glutamyltranspeptidase/glutathione hydrolase [Sulfitobacter guttiformis]
MRLALIGLLALVAGGANAQQAADAVQPEAAGVGIFESLSPQVTAALEAKRAGLPVQAEDWMVVAANPHAVRAGADVLAAGGTAADALVAVQVMLGLVEPQSSGLGGGAFLVWYDRASGRVTTFDGRETAPLAATPQLFQDAAGEPLGFFDAVVGGLSVGVPGTPALLAEIHARYGTRDWAGLLAPARALAADGFPVSPRLAQLVAEDAERLATSEIAASYFMPSGVPVVQGDMLVNLPYANTLKVLSEEGVGAFYAGDLAKTIVATVQGADNAGVLSDVDLAIYRVKERTAVCAPYRGHEICGMGPPSSGGIAVGQTLGFLEGYDLSAGPDDVTVRRLIADASRLAFADRGRYVADSDFVPVPVKGLLDPAYMAERGALLAGDDALPEVAAGNPEFDHALNWADDQAIELPSTSHISIVDSFGNVASMTTTIENGFGSRLMVGGFLLNNQLTDFSFRSHDGGVPIANRVEPGKRPRSSMAPTIVMKDGAPVIVAGSPGGSRIIGYTAQAIIAMIDWGLDAQTAAALPHAVNRFGTYDLEAGTTAEALAEGLAAVGYETDVRALTSGLHLIGIGERLQGGADPRREGIALGE